MAYVLYNPRKGFVALPGARKSFTRDIWKARRFATRELAKADACGDEYPVEFNAYT